MVRLRSISAELTQKTEVSLINQNVNQNENVHAHTIRHVNTADNATKNAESLFV